MICGNFGCETLEWQDLQNLTEISVDFSYEKLGWNCKNGVRINGFVQIWGCFRFVMYYFIALNE